MKEILKLLYQNNKFNNCNFLQLETNLVDLVHKRGNNYHMIVILYWRYYEF